MTSLNSKRKDLTLREKVNVIEYAKQSKCSQSEIAKKFGISQAQVSKLLKNQDSFINDWRANSKSTQKRKRSGRDSDVEQALAEWFTEKRARNVAISGPVLKEKAEEIAENFGNANFKATNGWFCRWKNRSQVSFKKIVGEAKDADVTAANIWIMDVLPSLIKNYEPECVYHCDETALYYRATPDGTFCFPGDKAVGGKVPKDRLTIMCCANSDGSHKLPLFVIGKSKSPRCFKGVKSLHVKYSFNKNAWMTTILFKEWLIDFDKKMAEKNRNVLLFVDNCSAHKPDVRLKNVSIHFLPANTTSLIQPMDQGIISAFKRNYRKEIIRKIIANMDFYDTTSSASSNDMARKISVLDAIHMMNKSWHNISENCIKNCFIKCKFFKEAETISPVENEVNPELGKMTDEDFSRFVTFDDNLSVFEDTEDLQPSNETNKLNIESTDETGDEDVSDSVEIPSNRQVLTACNIIRSFLEGQSNVNFSNYYNLEQQVTNILCNKKNQAKITDYFSRKHK